MAIKVTKTEIWAAEIQDQPGGLATVLGSLAAAGANLEFVIARRNPLKPGTGAAFVTPLRGKRVKEAARGAGFAEVSKVPTLRVEGNDRPGIGHQITRAVGDAGISFRGLSAAVIGRKFVVYIGFDSDEVADAAAKAIKAIDKKK
jgi:hypothetical protein